MIFKKIVISFFLLCLSLSFQVNASSLNEKLHRFIEQEYPFKKDYMRIIVHTPLKKNMDCTKPVFSFFSHERCLGLVDVLVNCDTRKYHLQVEIQAQGEYIVAKKKIPRGTEIKEKDLKVLIGRLDILPKNTYFKKEAVINRVNLRDIFPLQPITSFITRPFWLVQANQQVTVIFDGDGFVISAIAKSLGNGGKNEKVRVKMKNGKIFTGIIKSNGEVVISI